MKIKNKRRIFFALAQVIFILTCNYCFAQSQPPTGLPTAVSSDWRRGGNNGIGAGGTNNIFGTSWNSPIYTMTAGVYRTWLNGSFNGASQRPSIQLDLVQLQQQ